MTIQENKEAVLPTLFVFYSNMSPVKTYIKKVIQFENSVLKLIFLMVVPYKLNLITK